MGFSHSSKPKINWLLGNTYIYHNNKTKTLTRTNVQREHDSACPEIDWPKNQVCFFI